MFSCKHNRGFTLIEMMVVISIMVVIMSVLITSFLDARASSRDKERVSDLAQIEFALNAYREANRNYPEFDGGIEVGRGTTFDDDLAGFWETTVDDPLNDDTYHYYYDSNFDCAGNRYVVLMASNMEDVDSGNFADVCEEDSEYAASFIVLLDGPLSDVNDRFRNETGDEWWNRAENQTWADLRYNWDSLIDWDEEASEAAYNVCQDPDSPDFDLPSCQGCTDASATNYDSNVHPLNDDGSCVYRWGCTDPDATNYDVRAARDDGSCRYNNGNNANNGNNGV